jgi:hypothetical protein
MHTAHSFSKLKTSIMLQKFSKIAILDDSSILNVQLLCSNISRVYPGTMVLCVVRREMYHKRVFKKRKLYTLLMTIARNTYRLAGAYRYRFDYSSGLMLAEDRQTFIGWTFLCPVSAEIKKSAHRELCQYSRKTF